MAEDPVKQYDLQKSSKQSYPFSRERSFVRPHSQYQKPEQYYYHLQVLKEKRKSLPLQNVNSKTKPTMEIYRPPNVRSDGVFGSSGNGNLVNPKLNVHAKEFTMKCGQLQSSRSSGNIMFGLDHALYAEESLANGNQGQGTSSTSPRVHFAVESGGAAGGGSAPGPSVHVHPPAMLSPSFKSNIKNQQDFHGKTAKHAANAEASRQVRFQGVPGAGLQRSKSLGAADMMTRRIYNNNQDANDLGCFPPQIQASIFKAIEDPNQLSARVLMELVHHVMERVLESRKYAEPAAKLCIKIIEKEKNETFLESLLNNCQQWYQERERILKGTPPRISAFMAFLNEMYCQLKRRQLQLKTHQEGVPPGLVLLTLLSKCCQDCLASSSVSSVSEMESLFFVLTAIGLDLKQQLPRELESLLNGVRDAFLTANTAPAIRKTLLQLIELSAARWQLPAPAVMYYYPGTYK